VDFDGFLGRTKGQSKQTQKVERRMRCCGCAVSLGVKPACSAKRAPWVIFGSFLRGGPKICFQQSCFAMNLNKLFRHGDKKSWRQRYRQNNEDAESSKTGCSSPSKRHGKAYEQVPALIYDSYVHRILCIAAIWGGYFAHTK